MNQLSEGGTQQIQALGNRVGQSEWGVAESGCSPKEPCPGPAVFLRPEKLSKPSNQTETTQTSKTTHFCKKARSGGSRCHSRQHSQKGMRGGNKLTCPGRWPNASQGGKKGSGIFWHRPGRSMGRSSCMALRCTQALLFRDQRRQRSCKAS